MLSEWASIGEIALSPIDVTTWSNAEIALFLSTQNFTVPEGFCTAQDMQAAALKTTDMQSAMSEYLRRAREQKSVSGVSHIFGTNSCVRVQPGRLEVVKGDTISQVPDHSVGYYAPRQAEAYAFAASAAISATSYARKGAIVTTPGLKMPPIVREELKNSNSQLAKKIITAVTSDADVYGQRHGLAKLFLETGGFLSVCALFSKMVPNPEIPVATAPQVVLDNYAKHKIQGTSFYVPCAPPKLPNQDLKLEVAYRARTASRRARGEDKKMISPLCAPCYVGELPRGIQTTITTAFSLIMILDLVKRRENTLVNLDYYRRKGELTRLMSTLVGIYSPTASDRYSGQPGYYNNVLNNKFFKVTLFFSDYAEPVLSNTGVRDPEGAVEHINSLVTFMKRNKGITLCDVPAFLFLFERNDLVIIPHPIGHRIRVFIGLKTHVNFNKQITEREYSNYTIYCNLWRTFYPYHRVPMWGDKKGLTYFNQPPPIIVKRNAKNKDDSNFDVGFLLDVESIDLEQKKVEILAEAEYNFIEGTDPLVFVQPPIPEPEADVTPSDYGDLSPSPTPLSPSPSPAPSSSSAADDLEEAFSQFSLSEYRGH